MFAVGVPIGNLFLVLEDSGCLIAPEIADEMSVLGAVELRCVLEKSPPIGLEPKK